MFGILKEQQNLTRPLPTPLTQYLDHHQRKINKQTIKKIFTNSIHLDKQYGKRTYIIFIYN